MYITINDIIGSKRIDLSYPIKGKDGFCRPRWQGLTMRSMEITVVSMFSDNVQYWLQGHLKVQLKSGEEITLNKGVYTDKDGAESANDRFPRRHTES